MRKTLVIVGAGFSGTVLAANKLYLGEDNNGEWKKFGFNIDGKVSTGASVDVCKPNAGGVPGTAYPDGDNGIDKHYRDRNECNRHQARHQD